MGINHDMAAMKCFAHGPVICVRDARKNARGNLFLIYHDADETDGLLSETFWKRRICNFYTVFDSVIHPGYISFVRFRILLRTIW